MKKLKILLQYNITYIILVIISIVYAICALYAKESVYKGRETDFIVKVIDYKFDGDKLSITGFAREEVVISYYIGSLDEKKELESIVKFGNYLRVNGILSEPRENSIPNIFNYKDYLNKKGIFWIVTPTSIKLEDKTNNIFYKIKNYAYEKANKFQNSTYIYAYILGNTDLLASEVNESYSANGISHLFALSGLHVSIFSLLIMKTLSIFKLSEGKKYFITFLFLLLFSFITGLSPSILRATFLFFFLGLNKVFKLNIKSDNVLLFVFSLMLFISPNDLFSVGFQLSYIATYFLIISNYLMKDKNILLTYFIVSLISFVSTLPIIINMNSSVNLVSLFNNIIFVPYVTYIVFPLTLFTFIFPAFEVVLNFFTSIMEAISLFMEGIVLKVVLKDFNWIFIIVYYITLVIALKTKRLKLILINILIVLFLKFNYVFDKNTYVYFLDVGQGDSAFIRTKNNKTIIIDTGGVIEYKTEKWKVRKSKYSLCTDSLVPFYNSLGLKKIDYMFLSHGDADHAKEASCINEEMKVSNTYINLDDVSNYEKIGNTVKFDKEYIKIDNVLIYSLNDKMYDNENDNSLVFYIVIDDYSFLFMGDAGASVEKDIISKYNLKNVDILKVGHHGSNTSTSEEFIDKISPKYSVISVGKNNRYNHPSSEVVDNLRNSKIYRTDLNGSIMFKIIDNKLEIETFTP